MGCYLLLEVFGVFCTAVKSNCFRHLSKIAFFAVLLELEFVELLLNTGSSCTEKGDKCGKLIYFMYVQMLL